MGWALGENVRHNSFREGTYSLTKEGKKWKGHVSRSAKQNEQETEA